MKMRGGGKSQWRKKGDISLGGDETLVIKKSVVAGGEYGCLIPRR